MRTTESFSESEASSVEPYNFSYLALLQQYYLYTYVLSLRVTNCLLLAAGISLRVTIIYFMVVNHYRESTIN